MTEQKIPVVAVVGPTASGKTTLAVELALKFHGEVISGDSMQIYRGMDIGTAKPTQEEMKGVRHHLIDILDPWESYSVAKYTVDAAAAIREVRDAGKLPILCGGTGLYIDSLIKGVRFPEQEDVHPLREELRAEYDADGGESLYAELMRGDPIAAEKIHKNNAVKLIRAVEMLRSGSTLTERVAQTEETQSPYEALYIGLDFADRDKLYARIEKRVDMMFSAGLIEEARGLSEMPLSSTARAAIGYKELFADFAKGGDGRNAAEEVKLATRHYAKRQLTWFRRNKSIRMIEASQSFEKICADAEKYMEISTNL